VAEAGVDMQVFGQAKRLTSWSGLWPHSQTGSHSPTHSQPLRPVGSSVSRLALCCHTSVAKRWPSPLLSPPPFIKRRPRSTSTSACRKGKANYFERNAERMRCPQYRKQNLFVGSGVIEAGSKPMGSRRSVSSTVRGGNALIALRCCRHSRQFDDYWEHRCG
jgi:hypothetical protein